MNEIVNGPEDCRGGECCPDKVRRVVKEEVEKVFRHENLFSFLMHFIEVIFLLLLYVKD